MLALDKLCFAFNGRPILQDISFQLGRGEMAALLGVNGSGKSTLLKTINGILKPKHLFSLKGADFLFPLQSNGG